MNNKTKIVATLGPASNTVETISRLIEAGLNIARINFSHGDPTVHAALIENIRKAEAVTGKQIVLMADLPGPKMRIGELETDFIVLSNGDKIDLTNEKIKGNNSRVYVSYSKLHDCVNLGDKIYLNDGSIELVVTAKKEKDITCEVLVGGELRPRKGLNIPNINLGISAFTPHDFECLKFASAHGIDAVSQSFVENEVDIKLLRVAASGIDYHPFIIAKIERSNALLHLDAILEESDGLMVARGDLGVEVPIEQMAIIQKEIIRKANFRGKPVITATQMLESMICCNRPTRAEASDVANAILDGTDCVMLSAESAAGKFPQESVEMLARIAQTVEPHQSAHYRNEIIDGVAASPSLSIFDILSFSAEETVEHLDPAAVFIPSRTGGTVRKLSRYRLAPWIIAISKNKEVCQGLKFSYGVKPICLEEDPESWSDFVRTWVKENSLSGEYAVIIQGPSFKNPDRNHSMEIIKLTAVK
ncbi:MAG: pyruvate kinase [Deltaproteobacteria bacterium]|nr:pyruvate kinase [Deltaproteobacteria bacterium]